MRWFRVVAVAAFALQGCGAPPSEGNHPVPVADRTMLVDSTLGTFELRHAYLRILEPSKDSPPGSRFYIVGEGARGDTLELDVSVRGVSMPFGAEYSASGLDAVDDSWIPRNWGPGEFLGVYRTVGATWLTRGGTIKFFPPEDGYRGRISLELQREDDPEQTLTVESDLAVPSWLVDCHTAVGRGIWESDPLKKSAFCSQFRGWGDAR